MQQIVNWLKTSQCTVVLTGAGMSTESGIPDFRSKEGRWRQVDPLTVATIDAFYHDYSRFYEFYKARIQALQTIEPHQGHRILTAWQQQKYVTFIATQNVDQLHQLAGTKQVAELHGNIRSARCQACQKAYVIESFLQQKQCSCGGRLRPNVVLFGEYLPEEPWKKTLAHMQQADVVIVIGTSLTVYPVNELPAMTSGKLVYINLEEAPIGHQFDATLRGKADDILTQLNHSLNDNNLI